MKNYLRLEDYRNIINKGPFSKLCFNENSDIIALLEHNIEFINELHIRNQQLIKMYILN